jgi:Protein kinase domain.
MDGKYNIGDVVLGNWRLERLIGEGSYGRVFEAKREDFGQEYKAAIKIVTIPQNQSEVSSVRSEGMDEPSITAYFRTMVEDMVREFNLMAQLKGTANVVSYEDHAVLPHSDGVGWDITIRMELLTPLVQHAIDSSLSIAETVKLGIDLCRALELCQKFDIVHRDIKPENIFISALGDYKLGDFGIARTVEKTTSGLSKKGTYTYMAPEVYREDAYGLTVDIYSIGIVLYRMLNDNRAPFLPAYPDAISYKDRESALAKRMSGATIIPPKHASPELARIVLKSCSFDPKERYSSPTLMRQALENLAHESNITPGAGQEADEASITPSATKKILSAENVTVPDAVQSPRIDTSHSPEEADKTAGVFDKQNIEEATATVASHVQDKTEYVFQSKESDVKSEKPKGFNRLFAIIGGALAIIVLIFILLFPKNSLEGIYRSEDGSREVAFSQDGTLVWYRNGSPTDGAYERSSGDYELYIAGTELIAVIDGKDLIITGGPLLKVRFVQADTLLLTEDDKPVATSPSEDAIQNSTEINPDYHHSEYSEYTYETVENAFFIGKNQVNIENMDGIDAVLFPVVFLSDTREEFVIAVTALKKRLDIMGTPYAFGYRGETGAEAIVYINRAYVGVPVLQLLGANTALSSKYYICSSDKELELLNIEDVVCKYNGRNWSILVTISREDKATLDAYLSEKPMQQLYFAANDGIVFGHISPDAISNSRRMEFQGIDCIPSTENQADYIFMMDLLEYTAQNPTEIVILPFASSFDEYGVLYLTSVDEQVARAVQNVYPDISFERSIGPSGPVMFVEASASTPASSAEEIAAQLEKIEHIYKIANFGSGAYGRINFGGFFSFSSSLFFEKGKGGAMLLRPKELWFPEEIKVAVVEQILASNFFIERLLPPDIDELVREYEIENLGAEPVEPLFERTVSDMTYFNDYLGLMVTIPQDCWIYESKNMSTSEGTTANTSALDLFSVGTYNYLKLLDFSYTPNYDFDISYSIVAESDSTFSTLEQYLIADDDYTLNETRYLTYERIAWEDVTYGDIPGVVRIYKETLLGFNSVCFSFMNTNGYCIKIEASYNNDCVGAKEKIEEFITNYISLK